MTMGSKMSFSLNVKFVVYDDSTGDHVTVTEDGDGLGLVELRQLDAAGEPYSGSRITLAPEHAELVATAITRLVAEIRGRESGEK